MHRKHFKVELRLTNGGPFIFELHEPKTEEALLPTGKYLKMEDEHARLVLKKDYYRLFLDGNHVFQGHISLSPKTMNIVEKAKVYLRDSQYKTLRYVLKSGTASRVEKEFYNYSKINVVDGLSTLSPIGYVIKKDLSNKGFGFHFTKLETNAIPLSSIDFTSLIKEERLDYLDSCARTLAILHSNGFTHNDPKLKNFLLEKKRIMIIDLVKMNFSRNQLLFNSSYSLSSPKMQALRYDFLNFLGNAVYARMITDAIEIEKFIKVYVKAQKESCIVSSRVEKVKPHEVRNFTAQVLSSIFLHKTDKNIANIIKLINPRQNEGTDLFYELQEKKDGAYSDVNSKFNQMMLFLNESSSGEVPKSEEEKK